MAILEGKLYNCDYLPQGMKFYRTNEVDFPNDPGGATIAAATQAQDNKMYSVTLEEGDYHCWLEDPCDNNTGQWAQRTNAPDPPGPHIVRVVDPYTWFGWRAPGCD